MLATLRRILAANTGPEATARVAELNDAFRARPYATPNSRVLFSAEVMALANTVNGTASLAASMFTQAQLLLLVQGAFTEPMFDPADERRAGTIEYRGQVVVFRIAYLSLDFTRSARSPADEGTTARVMVLSLPDEETPYG